MLVHFIASRTDIEKDINYFMAIKRVVEELGHELSLDWITPTYELMQSGQYSSAINEADWKKINKDNLGALARADVVIAEATARGFSTGYQVATALQQKKPVLTLSRNNDLGGTFSTGLTSDFLRSENYTEENLHDIVSKFIQDNTIDTKDMRFNFFIDRQIYNYLRWAAFKTGKTKAEILRELVQREIDNKEDVV